MSPPTSPSGPLRAFAARLRSGAQGSEKGVRDVAALTLPQVVKALTGFITSIWLTRGLGPSGLGQYALVMSVSETVVGLSDLGIGQTAVRYASLAASRNDTEGQVAVLRWAFRIRIALVGMMVVALFIAAPFLAETVWHAAGLAPVIRIGLLTAIFTAFAVVPVLYFQSLRKFGMNSAVQIGQTVISFIGIAVLAWFSLWDISLVVGVVAGAAALGTFVFLTIVPRRIWWPPIGTREERKGSWLAQWRVPRVVTGGQEKMDPTNANAFAIYLILSTVIVLVTLRLDVWLMGILLTKSDIGHYNAGMRLALPLTMVLGAFTTALWPRASALTTPPQARALIRKTIGGSLLLAAGGVLYAFTVPYLAPVLFGAEYEASVPVSRVLALGYAVAMLGNPVSVIGYGLGLARYYWITNILQMLVVVIMLLWLLPLWGPVAAAVTFVVNNAVGGLVNGALLWRRVRQLAPAPEGQ